MTQTPNLRIPGPTPVPPDVLEAVAHPMVNHRGREFAALISRVAERLKEFYQTSNDVLILSTSGTGGLEAAVVNTLSPGDRVLSVSTGAFGERFAAIADTYGAEVIPLQYEWGQAARPEDVRQALEEHPEVKAVLVTHNETSTGVTNPLEEIAKVVRSPLRPGSGQASTGSGRTDNETLRQAQGERGPLLLVDAVSSLSSIPLETDGWGLDVVVTGSQKGWMVPPGLAFVSMNDRAWRAYESSTMPRFYFDLARHRDSLAKGQTPWTPTMSIFFGLDVALERMVEEGMEHIFARHASIGRTVRSGVKEMGLELLCQDERFASDTVTAVKCPDGVEVSALRNLLEDEYVVVVAGGQQKLQGKIFRIGHLGLVAEGDIQQTLQSLEQALPKLGFRLP